MTSIIAFVAGFLLGHFAGPKVIEVIKGLYSKWTS